MSTDQPRAVILGADGKISSLPVQEALVIFGAVEGVSFLKQNDGSTLGVYAQEYSYDNGPPRVNAIATVIAYNDIKAIQEFFKRGWVKVASSSKPVTMPANVIPGRPLHTIEG